MKRKKIASVILAGLLLVGTKYSMNYNAFAAKTKKVTATQQSISVTIPTPKGWKAYTKQELQQTVKAGSSITGTDASVAVNGLQYVIYNCKSTNGSNIVVFSQPNTVDPSATLSYMQSILTTSYAKAGLKCKITKRNDKYSKIAFSTLCVTASKTVGKLTYNISQEYSIAKYKNRILMILVTGVTPSEFKVGKSALKSIKIK